jgi:hypothetical protein
MSRSGPGVRFGFFLLIAIFGLAAQMPSQIGNEAGHGALELTSGLGRKLYSLPDDERVIDARKSLAADPNNVERVLQLSKAEAAAEAVQRGRGDIHRGIGFCSEERRSLP